MTEAMHRTLLAEAVDMLEQFRDYGEAMREHGRGFQPMGLTGHSVDTLLASILSELGVPEQKREHREGRWHVVHEPDRLAKLRAAQGCNRG